MSAQSKAISVSASGDNTVVTGVANFAVRVLGYVLTASAAVNARWMSDTAGNAKALSGLLYFTLTTSGSISVVVAPVVPMNGRGWFQADAGKDLNLNLSGAQAVGGHLLYELVSQ